MTFLGNYRRRKDRETAMKIRSPLSKWKTYNKPQQRQLTTVPSPIDRQLSQKHGQVKRIPLSMETVKAMEVEVGDLGVLEKPVTLAAMANALVGSRRVVDLHGETGKSMSKLAGITRKLQKMTFRRTKSETISMKRRYDIVNALNRLEKVPNSTARKISNWNEAKEALSAVFEFPEDDAPSSEPASEGDNDSTAAKYAKKLDDCFRINEIDGLVPLTDKWKKVAAHPIPTKLGQTEGTDSSLQEYKDALEKADRMFGLRVASAVSELDEATQSQAVKTVEGRLRDREREAEALRKASSLMRPLTTEEHETVREAMYGDGRGDDHLARTGSDYVQRSSMHTLQPGQWLNDEVIHYFLLMLSKRDEELCGKDSARKRCHFFKSFFLTKLLNEGHSNPDIEGTYEYRNVKRWSKKVPGKDMFKLDKVFFPINQGGMHWICACAFMSEKRIEVYDSMGSGGTRYLESIFQYIQDDHKDKKGCPLPDAGDWELVACRSDTPRQRNGYDCGVFTCMFIDFLAKDCPLVFSQEHVTQCRERIALSILNGKAIM